MKKSVLALAMVLALGAGAAAAGGAYAWNCNGPGSGYGMMRGGGYGPGNGYGGRGLARPDINDEAYAKFVDETAGLRKAIAIDRAELNALMAGTNPDPKRARELAASLADNREKMQKLARESNIDVPGANFGGCQGAYGPDNCPGPGYGRGFGGGR